MMRLILWGIAISCMAACQYQRPTSTAPATHTPLNDTIAHVDSLPTQVHIYIENSGSMNGYVNGNTAFKNALSDLLVTLKYRYGEKNLHLFYINSAIYPIPVQGDITQFAQHLTPQSIRVGNTASSDLNHIFNQILEKTDRHTISLLLSDCIYSIQGENTAELLNFQKSQTRDAYLSKSKEGLEPVTALVKLSSAFYGTYWDKNNQTTYLAGQSRPYYLSITGSADRMADFHQNIPLNKETLEGYQHEYILTSEDFSDDHYYSILTASFQQGRFKPMRSQSSADYVRGIKDVAINPRSTEPFRFAIAVDLSHIPVEEAYKTNPAHYTITEGDYAIREIIPVNKSDIHPSDWIRIQQAHATHIIQIQANSQVYSDLRLALKKQIPQWVYQTDTENDSDILATEGQTFGFKYLVEGIAEAYAITARQKDSYFEIDIPIRKAAQSYIGKGFLIVLIVGVALALGFMVVKNRNR